ncbi:MAG: type II secretion system protein [Patescibacteria group bacterium]
MRRGFTLFETLIGIALLGVLLGTITVLMMTSLRSSRKSAAIAKVNSEAASAVDSMVQMIKFAESAICTSPTSLDLVRVNEDDLRYSLLSGQIASISAGVSTYLTSVFLNVTDTGCGQMFTCTNNGRTVKICFDASAEGNFDTSDKAEEGLGEVRYQTEVTLRNFGN